MKRKIQPAVGWAFLPTATPKGVDNTKNFRKSDCCICPYGAMVGRNAHPTAGLKINFRLPEKNKIAHIHAIIATFNIRKKR
ncbi:MAG: hypothetical protein IKI11_03185 [Neisseriaceae bacterium]|nr:hypothetical protein [Neisseriaceae bacterium]